MTPWLLWVVVTMLSDEQLEAAYYRGVKVCAETTDDDGSGWDLAGLRAVEAAVRADMTPRVVSTVEELNALPDGSLIYMVDMRRPFQKVAGSWWSTWVHGKPVDGYTSRVSPSNPATVLWVPVTPGGNSNG